GVQTCALPILQDISNWLGNSLGVDESGKTIWNGVMGDLQSGQESVIDMMKRLDHDREVIHQQIRTKHATLQIIETDDVKEREIDPRLMCEWAAEAFKDFGGSKDRKSTRLNSSHVKISYAVFCLKKKKKNII